MTIDSNWTRWFASEHWRANRLVLSEICRYNPIPWSAAVYNSIYKYIRQLNALFKAYSPPKEPPIARWNNTQTTRWKQHVTSLPKYREWLTPKYSQKRVPYGEMRFSFCTHARLYDLPTRRPTLWGRPPRWQQIDSMLPCVCSVTDHRRRQNVVRTAVTHSAIASCNKRKLARLITQYIYLIRRFIV